MLRCTKPNRKVTNFASVSNPLNSNVWCIDSRSGRMPLRLPLGVIPGNRNVNDRAFRRSPHLHASAQRLCEKLRLGIVVDPHDYPPALSSVRRTHIKRNSDALLSVNRRCAVLDPVRIRLFLTTGPFINVIDPNSCDIEKLHVVLRTVRLTIQGLSRASFASAPNPCWAACFTTGLPSTWVYVSGS